MEIDKICFKKEELTNLDWVSDKISIYNLKEAHGIYLDAILVLTDALTFFDSTGEPVELSSMSNFTFKGKEFDIKIADEHEKFIKKVIFDSVKNQEIMAQMGKN